MKILLVEDHADTAQAMSRLLARLGYRVTVAQTCAGALALAAADSYDMVISDLGLPDASGCELMRQLLARRPIRGIALSGYGLEDDVRESFRAGFREHLTKPVSFNDLRCAIEQVAALP